jgi:hypothetical protein
MKNDFMNRWTDREKVREEKAGLTEDTDGTDRKTDGIH